MRIWTLGSLGTYDALFFIHLDTQPMHIASVAPHPHETVDAADRAQRDDGHVGLS